MTVSHAMRDRDLHYFLVIVQCGNLAEAASQLGVTQPGLTRAVQRLERQLDAVLFERTPRGMAPTPAGVALAERATRAHALLDEAEREVRDMALGQAGLVRIGCGSTLVAPVTTALFPRLQKERPAAGVKLLTGFNDDLYRSLLSGELDFICCALPQALPEGLSGKRLFVDQLQVICRRGHPLTALSAVRAADLAPWRWVVSGKRVLGRQWLEEQMDRMGLGARSVALETNSNEVLLDVVSKTDHLSFTATHLLGGQRGRGAVQALHVPALTQRRSIGLVWRASGYRSPVCLRAMELLEAAFTGPG